ncbi:amidohydrolase family protein [Sinomonas sp. ASV322]|uniref:amidohydrolase family protein n=1 Tax=Sinomonas sp. ASV322 TaxID=3041920 RepID=UPI0027DE08ED|nr:amidohydrolase family protein [Sinomonas sp. ASV322]MDQ4501548.1 amidohydrolase family protein [Sinomonas sp. ASV322]
MTSTPLTLANVRPWGAAPADIVVVDGKIASVSPAGTAAPATGAPANGGTTVDGGGRLALPGFINTHAHVDKSWWGQPWEPYGGVATTQGRIEHERSERDRLGIPGVPSTTAVLREFLRHGTTATRSHIDVDLGLGLRGIDVVRESAEALGGAIDVEIVAFPQDGVMRRPGVLALLDAAAEAGATHVGGLDPAGIDRDPVRQLDGLFEIAVNRGVGIDIHLHDGNDLGAFQIELIADRTIDAALSGRVNVSHGFALGDLPDGRRNDLLDRIREAGISWTTVAPPRGALPWAGMRERGVLLGLGTDGIRDLWSPYGDGDILRVALAFARIHGVRRDEDLEGVVRLATSGAAPFVSRDVHDLVPGARADIVLLDAENPQDALLRTPRREVVVAGGRVVVDGGELRV